MIARRIAAPDSLLARSFLLIALLLVVSVLSAFQLYRLYEREPLSRELAQQAVSVVNLTRAALINADPSLRRELLIELNEREGIRVYPLTPEREARAAARRSAVQAWSPTACAARSASSTRFAFARNGLDGFWVSFMIDVDEFWVMLPRGRFEPRFGVEWLAWGAALLALALLGAGLIASRIARPLAALTRAAERLGRGETPAPLPVEGPRELRTVSAAFNRMASDLASLERERAMVLAGISHDIRTPLARLRLGLEILGGERATAEAMALDIEEIDAVIGQFLAFARGEGEDQPQDDLDALVGELAEQYAAPRQARVVRARRRRAAALRPPGAAARDRQPGGQRAALRGRAGRAAHPRSQGRRDRRGARPRPRRAARRGRAAEAALHPPRSVAQRRPAGPVSDWRSSSASRARTAARSSCCRAKAAA